MEQMSKAVSSSVFLRQILYPTKYQNFQLLGRLLDVFYQFLDTPSDNDSSGEGSNTYRRTIIIG